MDLPNFFLADMPSSETLTPATLTDACLTLKRNRRLYLEERTTASLIRTLANVAEHWTYPDYPIREYTLHKGPEVTGFPAAILEKGLLDFMKEISEDMSLRETGTIVEVDHPERGKYLTVGNPVKLSASPSEVVRSPLLGEHTDEILADVLGMSTEEIEAAKADGAV